MKNLPSPSSSSSSNNNSNTNENLPTKLTRLSPTDLNKRDCFGNTILHLICKTGKNERLKNLLRNKNLNLLTTDLENGWNCLHIAIFNQNIVMANLIIQFASTLHKLDSLLKQKDREGLTPLDLFSIEMESGRLRAVPSLLGGLNLPLEQISKYSMKDIQVETGYWRSGLSVLDDSATYIDREEYDEVIMYSEDKCEAVEIKREILLCLHTLSDTFKNSFIRSVHMSSKHSVIVSNGSVLISGFGSKGRLGLGNMRNHLNEFVQLLMPAPVEVYDVAVSENHTLILTSVLLTAKSVVYAFGSNEFGCLARDYRISEELSPVPVYLKGMNSKARVACSGIHSICYDDHSVWMWGLNLGQMGFTTISNEAVTYNNNRKGFITRDPQELKFEKKIQEVVCSKFSTLVLTDDTELHLYMNGFHAKLHPPQYNNTIDNVYIFSPRSLTEEISIRKMRQRNNCVLLLYDDGNVLKITLNPKWTSSSEALKDLKYTRIWRAKSTYLKCVDADVSDDGSIVICVGDGSVYQGVRRQHQKKKALFKFSRISNVSNIGSVATDPDFKKFLFVRKRISALPFRFRKSNYYVDLERLSLLGPDERAVHKKLPRNKKSSTLRDWNRSLHFSVDPLATGSNEVVGVIGGDDERILTVTNARDFFFFQRPSTMTQMHKNLELSDEWFERKIEEYPPTSHYIKSSENDLIIPIHKPLLHDVGIFKNVFAGEDFIFKDKGMRLVENVIHVTGFSLRSILFVIHHLYTGLELSSLQSDLEELKREAYELYDFINPNFKFCPIKLFQCKNLVDLIDSHELNDTVIYVKDGYFTSYSFLLHATSAYFEASIKWKRNDDSRELKYEVDLRHLDRDVFDVILRYLHGEMPYNLMFGSKFEDRSHAINFLLSCIEASDELMIFSLKDYLEMIVSWFVDVHNVLLILRHAFELNCNKLFEYCLWVVYYNLPVLIFDQEFESIVNENNFDLLKRMDYAFKFFSGLKKAITYKVESWYEKDLDHLIRLFIYEGEKFNQIFNNSGFEPIFEIAAKREKKQSEFQPQPQPSPIAPSLSKLKSGSPSPPPKDDNSAILDENVEDGEEVEDNWQVFINRRRSSAARRLSTNCNNNETINNIRVVDNPLIVPSPSSKARQSSIIERALEVEDEAVKSKAKIKIPKTSQRDRKKSTFELATSVPMSKEASSSSRSITPAWNINNPSKLKQTTPVNSLCSSSMGTPSLSEIMFEQEKLSNPQQKPVKSLQEIQQEEEFEKWFSEERRKYQEQQQQLELLQQLQCTSSSSSKQGTSSSSSKQKRKKGKLSKNNDKNNSINNNNKDRRRSTP